MDCHNNSLAAFFALVQAGLWEREALFSQFGDVDYEEVLRFAEEQSVVGLVTAGIDHVIDVRAPQNVVLQFIGKSLQIEKQNVEMNKFVSRIVENMRDAGINTLLIKGQGVAQCYEKPLWRECGDVDLLLSDNNYNKAKDYLQAIATEVEQEGVYTKHLGFTINQWVVELHGSLRCSLSSRADNVLDEIQEDTFYGENLRYWLNGNTRVYQLKACNDAIFIFSHFLKHFYLEGLGLRQICDWCRLLWTFRSDIDTAVLEQRLRKMGLMSEWFAFGAYAVDFLGMSAEAMPLYSSEKKWSRKARQINRFIIDVGNRGNNRDSSYFKMYPFLIRKCLSMIRRFSDLIHHAFIFPLDSFRFSQKIMFNGLREAVRGK